MTGFCFWREGVLTLTLRFNFSFWSFVAFWCVDFPHVDPTGSVRLLEPVQLREGPSQPEEVCRGCPYISNSPLKIFASPKPRTCPYSCFSNDQTHPCTSRIRIRLLIRGVQMGRSASLLQLPASRVLADLSCWQVLVTHETSPFLLFIAFHKKIITWERNLTALQPWLHPSRVMWSGFLHLSLLMINVHFLMPRKWNGKQDDIITIC